MQTGFSLIDYVVLFGYLGCMVVIGYFCSSRNDTTERYFLGNRRIAWWAVGISIFATQLSAITYISIPGKAFESDWSWLLFNMGIPVVGFVVIKVFLPVFRGKNYVTIYEMLEDRFGPETRAYGAFAYILMQLGRTAIVLYLPSLALAEVTGLPVGWMILLMGLLVTVYTVMGGIEVVIWTDVVQAVVLVLGVILALFIIVSGMDGGFSEIIQIASRDHKFDMVHIDPSVTADVIWVILLGAFFTNLVPYASDQTVAQRYFTTASDREARRCLWLGVWVSVPASFLFFFLGSALYSFYQAHPDLLAEGVAFDRVFPYFIVHQMPPGISGLLIAAIFAGSMSSLDSSLNSISTVCTTDFYKRFMAPGADEKSCIIVAKWITIVVGGFSTGIAFWVAHSLQSNPAGQGAWNLFIAVQGLLGGGLAGIFCAGVLTKKTSQVGVMTGLVIAAALAAIVKYELQWHSQTYAAVSIVSAFIVSYGFSIMTSKK